MFFVTCQKKDVRYIVTASRPASPESTKLGVIADRVILPGTRTHRKKAKLKSCQVTFFDSDKGQAFERLANNFSLSAGR